MMRRHAFLLLLICASVGAPTFAASAPTASRPVGVLAQRGIVRVDGQAVPPSSPLFPGDRVTTDRGSVAVMELKWGAIVTLASNSAAWLAGGADLRQLELRQGALMVRTARDQATEVDVPGTHIRVGGRGYPALCRVAMLGTGPAIFADAGHVEVQGAGRPIVISPGKWFRAEAGQRAAGTGQKAGSVTAAIPAETVQHVGQRATEQLLVNSDVDWNDLVRTARTGRVRIGLLDGSVLNIGAGSLMHITKHDPQMQQTQVELTLGRMRADVKKLTKPGASFQVNTQTAVIGVVGTIFVIQALANLTRVWCIQGTILVRNILPAVVGQVTLQAGQYTTVPKGLPPTGAVQATPAQIQNAMNQTNVPTAPGFGAPPPNVAVHALGLGVAGVSAGMAGIALSRTNDAKSTSTSADANAASALAAANNAAVVAGNALVSATNTVVTTQAVLQAASPSAPSCGCK